MVSREEVQDLDDRAKNFKDSFVVGRNTTFPTHLNDERVVTGENGDYDSTENTFPKGLPTGKSMEDRASSSSFTAEDRARPTERSKPYGKVPTTAKDRARNALSLLAELADEQSRKWPGILKRYEADVINIAQRGGDFARQILITGSYNKAKSGVRSHRRLLGERGNNIGAESRQRFYAAVERYEEAAEWR